MDRLSMPVCSGERASLNITASTVVKVGPGRIVTVSTVTAGSAAGAVHDADTTGAAAAGNKIATLPNAVGVIWLDFPVTDGVVIVPGTGQVLSVTFS